MDSTRSHLDAASVIKEYDLKTVQDYMYHIRNNAEQSVRSLLREVVIRNGTNVLGARDYLDDGSPVRDGPGTAWKLQSDESPDSSSHRDQY